MHALNTVLVTGASGFIGRHLCKSLKKKGINVIALSRSGQCKELDATQQYGLDLRDRVNVREFIQYTKPRYVVHLAAMKGRSIVPSEYRFAYDANWLSSFNLVEACNEVGTLRRFVFLGSTDEYGRLAPPFIEQSREAPTTSYGLSKLAATQLLQTFARSCDFPAVILRPTIAYGPQQGSDMFLSAMIQALVCGERFAMTLGEQTRDYVYIDDLISAIISALLVGNEVCGQLINISSGVPLRVKDLANMVARIVGNEAFELLDFGARDYRQGEAMEYWSNNDLAEVLLNWKPLVSLENGLRQTIHSFQPVIC